MHPSEGSGCCGGAAATKFRSERGKPKGNGQGTLRRWLWRIETLQGVEPSLPSFSLPALLRAVPSHLRPLCPRGDSGQASCLRHKEAGVERVKDERAWPLTLRQSVGTSGMKCGVDSVCESTFVDADSASSSSSAYRVLRLHRREDAPTGQEA